MLGAIKSVNELVQAAVAVLEIGMTSPEQTPLHPDQSRWNEKYCRNGFEAVGPEPSQWLIQHEQLLREQPAGLALDVATGNGRHAVYLAGLGFTVDALDIADVAIARLGDLVRQRRIAVRPRWSNLETESLPKEQYQVAVNVNYLERRLFSRLEASLVLGGLLFFETVTTDQVDVLGHETDREYLLKHNELLHAFSGLHVLDYRQEIVPTKHGNKKAVASLVARKELESRRLKRIPSQIRLNEFCGPYGC